ncbi:MAG TPA: THUMP domain-containing protein [Myxococcaceae bacterium]|nr:THUMP domain-containing protein [Myxococcaceae bacterium]
MPERLQLYATASRGTEPLLAEELAELGAKTIRQDRGGVRFAANWREALWICLWSRIAMRVLRPLGQFEPRGAQGLYDAARSIVWEDHLTAETTFAVDATLRDSEHTHSGFVALKVKDAIADRLRERLGRRPNVDARSPDVRIAVHLARERLSLAMDLAGDPLNQRGYRIQPTAAPLKETLAAALLRVAGYKGEVSFVDPMCGSGTLVIEAALIAANRAPNLRRPLGIERWPEHGPDTRRILAELRAEAVAMQRKPPFPILGFDRDPDAVRAARRNAAAAKLSGTVRLEVADAIQPLALGDVPPGVLITNPPYGSRLSAGGQKGMKTFYFKLGENLRRLHAWRLFILAGNPAFESAFHLKPSRARTFWNGPIECRLFGYTLR